MNDGAKPRLLFLRFTRPGFPPFFTRLLDEQVRCLSQFFDVIAINDLHCDYKQLCDTHEPDIAMFESGIAVAPSTVRNVSSHPAIPKIGFINCDAYCPSRKTAIRDMARWEISTYFGMAVSLGSYTPAIADQLFTWPNSVDPLLYRDYGFPKVIPVLFSGSQAPEYPWRNRINRIVAQHFPSFHSPHFGWFWKNSAHSASNFLEGEKYAQLINSAQVAPTCGTIANEVVRKHFEIPACNTCLLTQRTAALEAAGFVDLVNCVFADESDVLHKLEWLFSRPEELERITRAGKELVDSRHTFRQRDQIFQWYSLHKQLKSGQKIVQPGPFLPLKIVEQNSGVGNHHIASQGIDRLIMNQGDAALQSGRYRDAEKLYRRCINYRGQYFAEPKFRLIRCWLNQGNSKAALASVREYFRSDYFDSESGREPDPAEWALFILVLLCCGKNGEAEMRVDQFTAVRSEELQRVRRMVRMLRGQNPLPETVNPTTRASVHDMPTLAIDAWLKSVVQMLEACGQIKTARALAAVTSKLQSLEMHEISKCEPPDGGQSAARAQTIRSRLKQRLMSATRPAAFENRALRYYLAASRRSSRAARRIASQWKQLKERIRAPWRHSPGIAEADLAMFVRFLQKEEMKTAVLIGAANGSWFPEAFMRGVQDNPNVPSAICVNHNTPEFRMFHRRYNDAANVEFRYLPNEGGGFEPMKTADIIAVHSSETLKDFRFTPGRASLILLDRIDSEVGSGLFRAMMRDANYVLVVYEPSRGSGYSIFRRVAVNAVRLSHQSAA